MGAVYAICCVQFILQHMLHTYHDVLIASDGK